MSPPRGTPGFQPPILQPLILGVCSSDFRAVEVTARPPKSPSLCSSFLYTPPFWRGVERGSLTLSFCPPSPGALPWAGFGGHGPPLASAPPPRAQAVLRVQRPQLRVPLRSELLRGLQGAWGSARWGDTPRQGGTPQDSETLLGSRGGPPRQGNPAGEQGGTPETVKPCWGAPLWWEQWEHLEEAQGGLGYLSHEKGTPPTPWWEEWGSLGGVGILPSTWEL